MNILAGIIISRKEPTKVTPIYREDAPCEGEEPDELGFAESVYRSLLVGFYEKQEKGE